MSRLLTLFILTYSLTFAAPPTVQEVPGAIRHAKNLRCSGILKQKPDGYLYLDVSNYFCTQLYPLIKKHLPPPPLGRNQLFFPPDMRRGEIGSHITVMLEDEASGVRGPTIDEIGRIFRFKVRHLCTIDILSGRPHRCWMLIVESRDLENLRGKYRLSPLPKGQDFHISLAYEEIALPTPFADGGKGA